MAASKVKLNGTKALFPLRTIGDVLELFKYELDDTAGEPDFVLLSLVLGYLEHQLTCQRAGTQSGVQVEESPDSAQAITVISDEKTLKSPLETLLPTVQWDEMDALAQKFKCQIRGSVDMNQYGHQPSRPLLKRISDVIWSYLLRSYYKDRAHLQTLFSFVTANKLDCFGAAYAVLAACQVLNIADVRMVMSEDHAWLVYGEDNESVEVTWHGKGTDDRRGQPVPQNNSWLYLGGRAILHESKSMTVAALVSAINPSLTASSDSEPLALLQQQLLWHLYDCGHLRRYPMAIGNLGDLQEMFPTRTTLPVDLYFESVSVAKETYSDHHVYPYCYLAGFYYRNGRFKDALQIWADAAHVIRQYNYTRDDEEIYKEFMEVANELIPHMVKLVATEGVEPSGMSSCPLLHDPECFSHLLRFYDGLCSWEEGSQTPVLHIGWAKPLVATISKFPADIRAKVNIKAILLDSDSDDEVGFPSHKNADQENVSYTPSPHPSHSSDKDAELHELNEKEGEKEERTGAAAVVGLAPCLVTLNSRKMAGLKDLLLSEKLNTSAIQLQLTAQSQVQVKKSRGSMGSSLANSSLISELDYVSTTTFTTAPRSAKRIRRD